MEAKLNIFDLRTILEIESFDISMTISIDNES